MSIPQRAWHRIVGHANAGRDAVAVRYLLCKGRKLRLTVTKLTDYHIMHIVRLLDSGLWIRHQLLSVTVL